MKTVLKLKMLILAMVVGFGTTSCKDDSRVPERPKPKIELSRSEISVMLGLPGEVGISNVTKLTIESNNPDVAKLHYDEATKKLKIETKATGTATFKIANQGDTSPVELKVTVTPVVFGMVNANMEMAFEAKYRFKTPKTLHLSPSGFERKAHFLKVTLKPSWRSGDRVDVLYKNPQSAQQNFQATVYAVIEGTVYLKTVEGRYIIFPI